MTGDGAYDTRRCHTAIIDRQATAIIPIRKNGRPWKEDCRHWGTQRNPACHAPLWQGVLETLDLIPRAKPDLGENALPQSLRRTHSRKRPRTPNRRNPDPHRTHEPLLSPRHRQDRSRGLKHTEKGEARLRRQLRNNALQMLSNPTSERLSSQPRRHPMLRCIAASDPGQRARKAWVGGRRGDTGGWLQTPALQIPA